MIINDDHKQLVTSILHNSLCDSESVVYVFGSRAKGNAYAYSDLDLAIDRNHTKIPLSIITKLAVDFENSMLPYNVDIVDMNNISDVFKKTIADDLCQNQIIFSSSHQS
jgi:predicted nucleotidyltransferase